MMINGIKAITYNKMGNMNAPFVVNYNVELIKALKQWAENAVKGIDVSGSKEQLYIKTNIVYNGLENMFPSNLNHFFRGV